MSTPTPTDRWTISCRYSCGTNIARNQATGLTCSATESERAAVFGLAQKLRPGFPAEALRQHSAGIWTLAKPSTGPAAIEAERGRP